MIPFQELKDGYNLAKTYKFINEINDIKECGRKDFGLLLKTENDLLNMSEDDWMERISDILEELDWSARAQLNYGIYMFATAKVY